MPVYSGSLNSGGTSSETLKVIGWPNVSVASLTSLTFVDGVYTGSRYAEPVRHIAAVNAGFAEGEFLTKPFLFRGSQLVLN